MKILRSARFRRMGLPLILEAKAQFSRDKTRRFFLMRRWAIGPTVLAVGLNPSIASTTQDDPTLRRLVRLLDAHGFGAVMLLNLWSQIAVQPSKVIRTEGRWTVSDWRRFHRITSRTDARLWMWGANGRRHPDVQDVIASDVDALCFGVTAEGMPKHPLYLPNHTRLLRFLDH
jgi:hypothetical protein